MRLAVREMQRRPLRFVVATVLITFLTILILGLGGLLDGLFLGSTGAIRAQQADVFVYSENSRESFLRSRITPEIRSRVEATPGVEDTGGLGLALVGAQVPGEDELADAAVIGYELAPSGVPDEQPPPNHAWADERLKASGVEVGDTLRVGPAEVPITVDGFVQDTNYLLQGALWVEPDTWRQVQNLSRPDARVGDGVFQVLLVNGGGAPQDLADAIDAATSGATSSLTRDQAVQSLPGTREQQATFTFIIVATFLVALLVVALFFALLVRERTGLYGVLKAIGASTRQLFTGLVVQAVLVSTTAFAIGAVLVFLLSRVIPANVPFQFQPNRLVWTLVVLVVVSILGGALSLRRVATIDPASAIGSAS
jgi:putative ABC transport system permease protein